MRVTNVRVVVSWSCQWESIIPSSIEIITHSLMDANKFEGHERYVTSLSGCLLVSNSNDNCRGSREETELPRIRREASLTEDVRVRSPDRLEAAAPHRLTNHTAT